MTNKKTHNSTENFINIEDHNVKYKIDITILRNEWESMLSYCRCYRYYQLANSLEWIYRHFENTNISEPLSNPISYKIYKKFLRYEIIKNLENNKHWGKCPTEEKYILARKREIDNKKSILPRLLRLEWVIRAFHSIAFYNSTVDRSHHIYMDHLQQIGNIPNDHPYKQELDKQFNGKTLKIKPIEIVFQKSTTRSGATYGPVYQITE